MVDSAELAEVADLVINCRRCAVLTGAGISAESGVPTFRGKEGLWGKFKPEQLASMEAFIASPKVVWEWYNWRRDLMAKVAPNPGHTALVAMEAFFDDFTVITQNVDNLHRLAGSTHLLELHGNIQRNKCVACNRIVDREMVIDPDAIPVCEDCGGKIRPDVVWFGELLPTQVIDEAFRRAEDAELFFSIGTSALVHPAASLPLISRRAGATLIEVNPDQTPITDLADYSFRGKSGDVLPQLVSLVQARIGQH
ncbi:NAD-dependent protein deacylase [candidate division GN15 bacterium]|nr:NAD-dependent protein deacylase [candidate division GN15 bacterium]